MAAVAADGDCNAFVCGEDYEPVCGETEHEGVTFERTFANMCLMDLTNCQSKQRESAAIYVQKGEANQMCTDINW